MTLISSLSRSTTTTCAGGVDVAEIAGSDPSVGGDHVRRLVGAVEVAEHRLWPACLELTVDAWSELCSGGGIDDAEFGVRQQRSDGARRGAGSVGWECRSPRWFR